MNWMSTIYWTVCQTLYEHSPESNTYNKRHSTHKHTHIHTHKTGKIYLQQVINEELTWIIYRELQKINRKGNDKKIGKKYQYQ